MGDVAKQPRLSMTELAPDSIGPSATHRTSVVFPSVHAEDDEVNGTTMVLLGVHVKVEQSDGTLVDDKDTATKEDIYRAAFLSFDGKTLGRFRTMYLGANDAMRENLRRMWSDRIKESAREYYSEQQPARDLLEPRAEQSRGNSIFSTLAGGGGLETILAAIDAHVAKLPELSAHVSQAAASGQSPSREDVSQGGAMSSGMADLLDPQQRKDPKWRMATDDEVAACMSKLGTSDLQPSAAVGAVGADS